MIRSIMRLRARISGLLHDRVGWIGGVSVSGCG